MEKVINEVLSELCDFRKETNNSLTDLSKEVIKAQKDIEYTQLDVKEIKEAFNTSKKEIEKDIIRIVKQKGTAIKLWISLAAMSGLTTLILLLINKIL